jgi:hypothetical protein
MNREVAGKISRTALFVGFMGTLVGYAGVNLELSARYADSIQKGLMVNSGIKQAKVDVSWGWGFRDKGHARSVLIKGLGDCSLQVYADPPRAHHVPLRLEPGHGKDAKIVSTGQPVPHGYVSAEIQSGQLEDVIQQNCHTPGTAISTR